MSRRSALEVIWIVFSAAFVAVNPRVASPSATDEQGVRVALTLFKSGIDTGNRNLGPTIATGPFREQFVAFYDLLVDTYAKYRLPMPMEIGHIRILKDGRAKVETYLNPARDLVVFTLVRDGGQWKFRQREGILIPLFNYPEVPYERIAQLPGDRRGFMMAERDLAFRSYVYEEIKKDRGEQGARDFFLDGPGFKAAMDAWLPFLEGAGQFAVFVAILESNYYGSTCVVTRASEDTAEVHFRPLRDLEALKTADFDPKMTPEEFQMLYRHIMHARAEACGLVAEVSIQDTNCLLKLRKK